MSVVNGFAVGFYATKAPNYFPGSSFQITFTRLILSSLSPSVFQRSQKQPTQYSWHGIYSHYMHPTPFCLRFPTSSVSSRIKLNVRSNSIQLQLLLELCRFQLLIRLVIFSDYRALWQFDVPNWFRYQPCFNYMSRASTWYNTPKEVIAQGLVVPFYSGNTTDNKFNFQIPLTLSRFHQVVPTVNVSGDRKVLHEGNWYTTYICCIPSQSSKLKTSQHRPFVTRCPPWNDHKLLKYMQPGKDILLRFGFNLISPLTPSWTSLPITSFFSHKTSPCYFAFIAVDANMVELQTGPKVVCTGNF